MTRRAALAVIAGAGLGFAAFGPRGTRERSDGRVVLDYWEKWTGAEGRAMQGLVDRFNQSQDRIYVRYLTQAGVDQKALISIAAGDPPDIIGLYHYNIPQYAETGALMSFDELDPEGHLRPENYEPAIRPIMLHPDRTRRVRQWAVINTCGTLALYYNRSIFREVGLDPDRPPQTVSELVEANRRIEIRSASGDLERLGFFHLEPGWWSWIWSNYFGRGIYDPASDRMLLDDAATIGAFEWMQSEATRLGVDASRTFRAGLGTYDSTLNGFLTGKIAMVVQGPWLANVIAAHGPKDANGRPTLDYGVTPFVTSDSAFDASQPVGAVESDVLVVPKGCRFPREAMEFIRFTQRQDQVEALSLAHYKNSPLVAKSESFLANHPNRGVRVFDSIAQSPRGFLAPRTRAWPQIKGELDAAFWRLWASERPARDELATLQTRTQAMLDLLEEQRNRRGFSMRGSPG